MKIIHVVNSLAQGGAEMTLVRLINNSSESHLIITILKNNSLLNKIKKPIKVISIFPLTLKKIKHLNYQINSFSPDIFQGWMYHGDFFASFFGIIYRKKIFWNLRHGKMSFKYSSKKTIILRALLSILSYFIPSKIISCSWEGLFTHKKIGYSSKKIIVIPNGIEQIYKKNIVDLNFSKEREITIASIGRDNPQKGRSYFIKIIKELSSDLKVKGFVVGRGVTSSLEIKNAIEKHNIHINLYESFENINEIFKMIDILLVTSNFGEGCPNVLIEAMQSRVLCFSTDVGDAKFILNNEQLLIPDNNSLKSKKIISNLINNPTEYKKIIEKNYLRSNKVFSPKIMVEKYENTWKST